MYDFSSHISVNNTSLFVFIAYTYFYRERMNSDSEFATRVSSENKVINLAEDNIYSVFVTFVEIYNNTVYDLLDESNSDCFRPTPMK